MADRKTVGGVFASCDSFFGFAYVCSILPVIMCFCGFLLGFFEACI